MLNQITHRQHILSLLLKLYGHTFLGSTLGFKGGTAAYLFYGLPRFSVDLDFDLLPSLTDQPQKLPQIIKTITELVQNNYRILDQSQKYNTLFWLLSYEKGQTHIKIEVSARKFSNSYQPHLFYGVTLPVLTLGDMIAHKLVAIQDRRTSANRDLFDAHFFLSSPHVTEINYQLVKERTDLRPLDFYQSLLSHLEERKNQSQRHILDGLGELLTQSQKDWARTKLLDDLVELVRVQRDSFF